MACAIPRCLQQISLLSFFAGARFHLHNRCQNGEIIAVPDTEHCLIIFKRFINNLTKKPVKLRILKKHDVM